MFAYYLKIAANNLKRNKALTVLMVLTIAIGIGTSMTTITLFRALSKNPIPEKSDVLFRVQLDPEAMSFYKPGNEPNKQMTRFDSETLLKEGKAKHQTIIAYSYEKVESSENGVEPSFVSVRHLTADFFPMFMVPVKHGRTWNQNEDDQRARVTVISAETNQKLFGGEDSTGKTISLDGTDFRIIGVLDDWNPQPKFYDHNSSLFGSGEAFFIPFDTARDLAWGRSGNMECWDARDNGQLDTDLNVPCAWLQYWVELDATSDASSFKDYLTQYSARQKEAGRFERPPNVRLRNVTEWLDYIGAVPDDSRLQMWLALGFLIVCMVNVVGLLMAKFLRHSGEVGVRQALGASKRQIFSQHLIESGVIGVAGGVVGVGFALIGLWFIRQQPAAYNKLAEMDISMLLATLGFAVLVSLLSGLLPAWRTMKVSPAMHLKTQ